jgi:hypothetical protein
MKGWKSNMAKKPLQFQVPERFRSEIETYAKENDLTMSEFLRQSARLYIILKEYTDQGYKLVLRKTDDTSEKEIVLA